MTDDEQTRRVRVFKLSLACIDDMCVHDALIDLRNKLTTKMVLSGVEYKDAVHAAAAVVAACVWQKAE